MKLNFCTPPNPTSRPYPTITTNDANGLLAPPPAHATTNGHVTPDNRTPTPESDRHRLYRQITYEKEPDSLDSVINNPQSYPITIVPNRPTTFYGFSPTGKQYNRQTSSRSRNYRPGSMRKVRRRAVFKNGDCNVLQKNLTRRRLRFLQDMYTTLVDSQWRWTLLAFALSFILSWLIFAVLWWLIMYTHGDLEEMHLPNNQEESGWEPCVSAINGFTSCFLFSIETQHTIGYGVRTTSEACPEAIFMMCFQSIYGVMSSAFMAGIVFAKMTRAKQRAQTLLFSKNAVICQRDGCLSLMFRVGDMRKSHIIGAGVRAQLIRTRSTKEGEVMTQHFTELEIGADECGSDLFFIWPMIIEHKIDENSPLYNMSATDLLQDKFEIVVILEGTVESTGQSTQARSSYVNAEILWGHRFDPVVVYNKDRQAYEIDYARFNETTQVDTPLCSARELNEIYKIQEGFRTPDFTAPTPPPRYTRFYRQLSTPILPLRPPSAGSSNNSRSSTVSTTPTPLESPLLNGRSLRYQWQFNSLKE